MCESKEKKERFFFSCETYTRIIVIDLIILTLLRVYHVIFFLQGERVFHVNMCFVCDYYSGLLIFVIILFGTQQVVSELRLE